MSRRLITTEEAARILNVGQSWLKKRRWAGINEPPVIRIGRLVRYDARDVESFIEASTSREES